VSSALSFRRWGVIVAAVLAGLLTFVSMLVDPVPDAEGRELLQGYADEPGLQGLHTNLIHYGFAMFAPVAYALVGLVRGRGAWIANVAAVLAVLGLSTLPGLVLLDYLGVATVNVAGVETAFQASEEVENLPGFTALIVPAFLASLLALPVAVVATWRARLVPWWTAAAVAAAFLLLLLDVIPWARLSFGIHALAMLALAYALWRIPPAVWHGRGEPPAPSGAPPPA
jgi:hypothetical protein